MLGPTSGTIGKELIDHCDNKPAMNVMWDSKDNIKAIKQWTDTNTNSKTKTLLDSLAKRVGCWAKQCPCADKYVQDRKEGSGWQLNCFYCTKEADITYSYEGRVQFEDKQLTKSATEREVFVKKQISDIYLASSISNAFVKVVTATEDPADSGFWTITIGLNKKALPTTIRSRNSVGIAVDDVLAKQFTEPDLTLHSVPTVELNLGRDLEFVGGESKDKIQKGNIEKIIPLIPKAQTGPERRRRRRRAAVQRIFKLLDPCAPNTCQNKGTCKEVTGGAFKCDCPAGFSGTNCEIEQVNCGQHKADTCKECPTTDTAGNKLKTSNGETWCNGDCKWNAGTCDKKVTVCTTNGAKNGVPDKDECVFPFKFGGKTYDGCTTDGWPAGPDKKAWCPTDQGGGAIDVAGGFWGYCTTLCTMQDDLVSIFAFMDEGTSGTTGLTSDEQKIRIDKVKKTYEKRPINKDLHSVAIEDEVTPIPGGTAQTTRVFFRLSFNKKDLPGGVATQLYIDNLERILKGEIKEVNGEFAGIDIKTRKKRDARRRVRREVSFPSADVLLGKGCATMSAPWKQFCDRNEEARDASTRALLAIAAPEVPAAISVEREAACNTETGGECEFPFKHQGTTYYGCITDLVVSFNEKGLKATKWCATKKDLSGKLTRADWEHCDSSCPTHNQFLCLPDELFGAERGGRVLLYLEDGTWKSYADCKGVNTLHCHQPAMLGPENWTGAEVVPEIQVRDICRKTCCGIKPPTIRPRVRGLIPTTGSISFRGATLAPAKQPPAKASTESPTSRFEKLG